MAATRQKVPPLEVWQDEQDFKPTNSSDQVGDTLLDAFGPLSDASNKANVQLNPSTSSTSGSSPSKKNSSPPRPISSHQLKDYRLSPPRRRINFPTDSPQKNGGFYSMYQHAAPKLEGGVYSQYPTASQDKENAFEYASFGGFPMASYPQLEHGYTGPMKRPNMEMEPQRPVKQQKRLADDSLDLPRPEDLPGLPDDGTKPPHSYAELIGMAILRAPNRRLTLAQIYKWISDTFSYYQRSEGGWQNSIRHNLSLNKNFVKQERPKDDPGKGNYWAIKPGEERVYLLGKKQPMRKIVNPDGSSYTHGLPMPPVSDPVSFRSGSVPAIGNFTVGPSSARKTEVKDIDSAKFPDEADLSSDGTIPASDPALQDDDRDEDDDAIAMPPPPPTHLRSSPPPADLGSSPPSMSRRNGTPPTQARHPSSSRSAGRRRKFAGMNDSGYWSSIESSAARGAAQQLASEEHRPHHRIKKGRAEAEIARMRSSSFDSPSKEQHRLQGLPGHVESSPTHQESHPLTPAVVFKRPARPHAAISPNTNLQDHRNRLRALLGSPAKTFSPLPDTTWSPAFNLAEEGPIGLTPFISPYKQGRTPFRAVPESPSAAYHLNNAAFDIFIDAPEDNIAARGSPEKRERPSLARAATSTGILADITGSKSNAGPTLQPLGGSRFSLSPFTTNNALLRSPAKLGSPLKQSHEPPTSISADDVKWLDVGFGAENLQPGQTVSNEDVAKLFGMELPSDGSEEGIDLFQDFGKIGQPVQMAGPDRSTGSPVRRTNMGPPARPAPRPAFARSSSNRW